MKHLSRRVPSGLAGGLAVLGLVVGITGSAIVHPQDAFALSCPSGSTTWTTVKDSNGTQNVLFTNGSGSACVSNSGGGVNYDVTQSAGSYTGSVLNYADLEQGCEGGYCSYDTTLPQPVSTVTPTVSWAFTFTSAGSEYDALIDNEFSSNCTAGVSDPAINANIAVYLNAYPGYSKLGLANSGSAVTIDGLQWYTLNISDGGNYKTEFSLVNPTTSVSNLAMAPFYSYAETHGSYPVPSTDCLTDLGVGNEIWEGGVGLTTTSALIDL
jgi:hypothetical protein